MIQQVRERTTTELAGPRAFELCAGFGGIGLGLQSLGFSIVRAYDSWDEAVAVYNHNFSGERAVCRNLLSAAGVASVKEATEERQDIELLAAGPPCKGFSQLRNGNHDGRNGNNRVLAAMLRYVALIRPRMVPDRLSDAISDELWTTKSGELQEALRRVRAEMERHEGASQAYETAGLQILELAQSAYSVVRYEESARTGAFDQDAWYRTPRSIAEVFLPPTLSRSTCSRKGVKLEIGSSGWTRAKSDERSEWLDA